MALREAPAALVERARLREMATARAMERVTTSTLVAKEAVRQLLQEQRRRRKRRRT
jgi:hypothetical protein